MAQFYDNAKTGRLHFCAPSGGGSGLFSLFDAPATADHIAKFPVEYGEYQKLKELGSVCLKEKPTDLAARDLYISQLENQNAQKTAEIERLNAHIAELESR